MSRVDFYVLPDADEQGRRLLACKLTEKAWRLGLRVYVRAASEREAALVDDLLWTFRQGSFVPHALTTAATAEVPVWVGPAGLPPPEAVDFCINLASDDFDPAGYQRIAEIIDQDETRRNWGRERYRHYKERGLQLETHRL
jgi:DNA polymerase-3 subunit chi